MVDRYIFPIKGNGDKQRIQTNILAESMFYHKFAIFQRLTALDGKRRFALAAAGSHKEEVGRLREYFEEVDRTWETFEQTLWSHISNFFELAKE
nr:exocyst complex component SEC6 [Tanacetum cinerariifolium]